MDGKSAAVELEKSTADVAAAPLDTTEVALDDDVAVAGLGACHQQSGTRVWRTGWAAVAQRDLLADHRFQVGVEGQQELLNAPAALVRGHAATGDEVEQCSVQKAEQGVSAAIVQEAEAADLVTLVASCCQH